MASSKLDLCTSFILSHLPRAPTTRPLFVGLNGVQGVGKTTLVNSLQQTLSSPPHSLPTLVLSIDDFYLPRHQQVALASQMPKNKLLYFRGQPGTHDVALAAHVLEAVFAGRETRLPRYDKAALGGLGDRVPEAEWPVLNAASEDHPGARIVILEGWCVGFRAPSEKEIEEKWRDAPGDDGVANGEIITSRAEAGRVKSPLKQHALEDLLFVNEKLKLYNQITDMFDAFVHIDTENMRYVYEWRLEQEEWLIRDRGTGMSPERVVKFVDSYYPSYVLYTEQLRNGVFPENEKVGRQLRLIVGKDRHVKQHLLI